MSTVFRTIVAPQNTYRNVPWVDPGTYLPDYAYWRRLNYVMDGAVNTVTIDCTIVSYAVVSSLLSAFTFNAPTSPIDGMVLEITVHNYTASTAMVATWNAIFNVIDWVDPLPGKSSSIRFRYDPNWTSWWQVGQCFAGQRIRIATAHSANENVTPDTVYGHWHDVTGAYTVTLPAAVIGMNATFNATTAAVFSIDCQAADHFVLAGVALTNGNKISSDGFAGSQIEVVCTAANTWRLRHTVGVVIDGGA